MRVNIFNECFSRKILWSAICGQPTSKKVLERVIGLLFFCYQFLFGAGTTLYFKLMFNTVTPEEIQAFFLNDFFPFSLAFGVASILIFLIGFICEWRFSICCVATF